MRRDQVWELSILTVLKENSVRQLSAPPQFSGEGLVLAEYLVSLGYGLILCGDYAPAEGPLTRALAIRESELEPNHPKIATALYYVGWLYKDQGRYEEAEPLYQRSLAIKEKVLGPEHPSVATTLKNYAGLLRKMGRDNEARALEARLPTSP